MSLVSIKLAEPSGLTRRVSFHVLPNWHTLATKIALLFSIPFDNVSVSYLDSDNDHVTLSSQEELDDYYANFYKNGSIIKFTVQDLKSARLSRSNSQAQSPNVRNTFGVGAFDVDGDWQIPMPSISGLGGIYVSNPSDDSQPHAFVETVASDDSTITDHQEGKRDRANLAPSVHSVPESPLLVPLDKGKAKAFVDDDAISSTGSVLAEDAPPKPPVHVYDLSSKSHDQAAKSRSHSVLDAEAVFESPKGVAESIPKTNAQAVDVAGAAADSAEGAAPDPPLPSFAFENASQPPSLASDLATLLGTLSTVVGAHPELSEGMRNIARNTANGAYWRSHREAVSRAAQEIARETGRTANNLREAEAEAGRRIAEAVSNMFGAVHQSINSTYVNIPRENIVQSSASVPVVGADNTEANGVTNPSQGQDTDPPHHDYPGAPWMPWGRWGQRVPPPFPFGPPRTPHDHRHTPFVPPTPPHDHGHIPFAKSMRPPAMPGSWFEWVNPTPAARPAPPSVQPSSSPIPPPPSNPPASNKPTLQELRSQVEEAKAQYISQKERYRTGREEQRRQRGRAATVEPNIVPPEPIVPSPLAMSPVIAVQDKDGNPTHEVVNVRRHHTHLGHSHSKRHGSDLGSLKSRTINRIAKRLADMGFTESAHPELPSRIKAQLPADDGVLSNDEEDNIVTTLLEELLALSPKPPVASGSGIGKGNRFPRRQQ